MTPMKAQLLGMGIGLVAIALAIAGVWVNRNFPGDKEVPRHEYEWQVESPRPGVTCFRTMSGDASWSCVRDPTEGR